MKKIAVLLRSNTDEWLALLRAALPQHIVVGDVADAADAAYAVVGKPAPGVLAALGELQIVFSVNAGVEALLESGEVPDGIPIVRMVDDGLAEGMLEWVLATTLAWHRNLFAYRDRQLQGAWAPLREVLARDRRVTVLGAGHLGGRAAAALAQIGFKVRVWSRTAKQIPGVVSTAGDEALPSAIQDAEILINLLPLTPATEDLLDVPLLTGLAQNAVLINAGRGRHVVDRAVIELLDSGRLRAAVLDVFREEPLPHSHPFWRHPGVYITPHVAAPTHASTAVAAIAENLLGHESGAELRHVVDLTRGY
jgi:glyoxylate/hydroxypyruvate reductase A